MEKENLNEVIYKYYDVDIYFKHDPEEKRHEVFGLEAENLEDAKEFVKERDDFDIIDYYTIEEQNGNELYNSSLDDAEQNDYNFEKAVEYWEDWEELHNVFSPIVDENDEPIILPSYSKEYIKKIEKWKKKRDKKL